MSREIYVWSWLPGCVEPVVAGVLAERGARYDFAYARSYLARPDAIALAPDLPLSADTFSPVDGELHGVFADALPDSWGRRVIDYAHGGEEQSTRTYLLESGSNRFGALDFQLSPSQYIPRETTVDVTALEHSVQEVLRYARMSAPDLAALEHGTSIGGAKPKVAIGNSIIKLSTSSDSRPLIRTEAVASFLARAVGINLPDFNLTTINGRDALVVQRFDRSGTARHHTRSLLTVIDSPEALIPRASYLDLVELTGEKEQVFRRVAANMIVGNSDDHARNHALIWDGHDFSLAPAFDIETTRSTGWEANLAMPYSVSGERRANLQLLVRSCGEYGLETTNARNIVEQMVETAHSVLPDALQWAGLPREAVPGILHQSATSEL